MKNSEKLIALIDSFYGTKGVPIMSYVDLCMRHAEVIAKFSGIWKNIRYDKPEIGTQCFAIEDLSPVGKGIFVSDYWYQECGFVANEHDNDPYGFITYWIAFDTVNAV